MIVACGIGTGADEPYLSDLKAARAYLGHIDTGIRVAHAVHNVVKDKMPSKIEKAATKGFTDYEKAREAIRLASGAKDD